MKENQKLINEGVTFLLRPNETSKKTGREKGDVAFIARNPGPASVLSSVANEFLEHGYPVWMTASGPAVDRITKKFSHEIRMVDKKEVPEAVDNIILSEHHGLEPYDPITAQE